MPRRLDAKITWYNLSFLLINNEILRQPIPWHIEQRMPPNLHESHRTQTVMQLLFLCLTALLHLLALEVL
jgi:hypothetical protein